MFDKFFLPSPPLYLSVQTYCDMEDLEVIPISKELQELIQQMPITEQDFEVLDDQSSVKIDQIRRDSAVKHAAVMDRIRADIVRSYF